MTTPARLHRRSFMLQVAGAVALGGAAVLITGPATGQPSSTQRPTGRSDTDAGANADRGGYGRTGVTDRDPSDGVGRGVGSGSAGAPASGALDDHVEYGGMAERSGVAECRGNEECERNQRWRHACRRTGYASNVTDTDNGRWADLPGRGRQVSGFSYTYFHCPTNR